MLTRLRVSGFKNLVDVDVRFGPFTCIAGANGVGKSNLFDAILFLSHLAELPFLEAASSVRDESGRHTDPMGLFHRHRGGHATEMSFSAEMIVPQEGIDDLGQPATAAISFVTYKVVIGCRPDGVSSLELKYESLDRVPQKETDKHLLFPNSHEWLDSAITTRRRPTPFISMSEGKADAEVRLHQEGVKVAPFRRLASTLPRTVLSSVNAAEHPTALLVKKEMQSWRHLQLEPTAMRRADSFRDSARVSINGGHLPGTLYRLAKQAETRPVGPDVLSEAQVYGRVANQLAELIDGVRSVRVDRDEKRELLTIFLRDRDGREFPARDLSDGTLRFLALSIIELDTTSPGVICFEEPENGIHPERIPAMLQLLQDLSTSTDLAIGIENPLRQVIINTHSPTIVNLVPADSLVVASLEERREAGLITQSVQFGCLPDQWRTKADPKPKVISRGKLLSYLNPIADDEPTTPADFKQPPPRRVIDLYRDHRSGQLRLGDWL